MVPGADTLVSNRWGQGKLNSKTVPEQFTGRRPLSPLTRTRTTHLFVSQKAWKRPEISPVFYSRANWSAWPMKCRTGVSHNRRLYVVCPGEARARVKRARVREAKFCVRQSRMEHKIIT